MRKVILIKLGGSVITNKSKPFTLRQEVLADLVSQVARAWKKKKGLVVLGHGQGSFAHVPAEKYKTMEGNVNGQSVYGAAVVEDAACQMNRVVVAECLKQNLPAVSVSVFNVVRVNNGIVKAFLENIEDLLTTGFLPVVYGDVVLDEEQDFTIWSTEKVLGFLAEKFASNGLKVDKLIHCGETDGFMVGGKVVDEINSKNFGEMKKSIRETEGFDVTGGMLHKVDEALALAGKGVDSYIVGGNHGGNLYRAIVGDKFVGTRVTA